MKQEDILVSKIDPNPQNPRGIDINTQDKKQSYLKESIKQFGILVPLVVIKVGSRYKLLDGERRFVAAKALGFKEVPAYVTTTRLTETNLLLRMFHIHHNREAWGPIPQCHALENLYKQLISYKSISNIQDEDAKIRAISERIATTTGIESQTAQSRVWFLRWPKDIRQRLYANPTDDYWYICEIESKIIIPALKNYPEYFKKVPVDEVRRDLFKKLEAHSISGSTEVRVAAPLVRTRMRKKKDRTIVLKLLDNLRKDPTMTYNEAKQDFQIAFPDVIKEVQPSLRKLLTMITNLSEVLQNFQINTYNTHRRNTIKKMKEIKKSSFKLADTLSAFIKLITDGLK